MEGKQSLSLKDIPSVTAFLNSESGVELCYHFGEALTKVSLRNHLDDIRAKIQNGSLETCPGLEDIALSVKKSLIRIKFASGRQAINATGILLHTGLGRAPFCEDALEHLQVFNGYSVLQTDIETGKRSLREDKIEKMLIHLTGCEAATVVNNNAAATMLILNTLAEHREVIVSRGQLVEIGGAFRLPDVMEKSGVILREIGTTNRTHLRDYEAAINDNTGAMIHVHTSNYRIRGFTGMPSISDICELRKSLESDVAVIDDLGSGALVPLDSFGVQNEPLVRESITAGADVVCFSGDKLICGPQIGIICGKRSIIEKIRKNPFARMFRVDKMALAVLETTLVHFINETYRDGLPFYRMLSTSLDDLDRMAQQLAHALGGLEHFSVEVIDDFSYIGSGSAPDEGIKSKVVMVKPLTASPNSFADKLRANVPSIFCRLKDGALYFDMRTLLNNDYDYLLKNLPEIIWESC